MFQSNAFRPDRWCVRWWTNEAARVVDVRRSSGRSPPDSASPAADPGRESRLCVRRRRRGVGAPRFCGPDHPGDRGRGGCGCRPSVEQAAVSAEQLEPSVNRSASSPPYASTECIADRTPSAYAMREAGRNHVKKWDQLHSVVEGRESYLSRVRRIPIRASGTPSTAPDKPPITG